MANKGHYYRAWQDRSPGHHKGQVEWPSPVEGALDGVKFLVTGVLETIDRKQLQQLIRDCGGQIGTKPSKSLDLMVVGREAGPKKLKSADELAVKTVDEAEFYEYLVHKLRQEDELGDNVDKVDELEAQPSAMKPRKPTQEEVAEDIEQRKAGLDPKKRKSEKTANTTKGKKRAKK
ncbi:Replication factor C subunit 1 [Halotydeus destructor]|nr:Replication factor C subunit 1 [Halotydeus destructor]